jgi:hypothetical protein
VFVRWKALCEQPIGWHPDLDDGVRLNIRPFVTAGVLRSKVNVHWKKDRGTNPDGSERINDLHPSLDERREARQRHAVVPGSDHEARVSVQQRDELRLQRLMHQKVRAL